MNNSQPNPHPPELTPKEHPAMSDAQTPTIGRIVQYTLSEQDAVAIHQRRATGSGGYVGNPVEAGDVYPMLITRVWGDAPESAVQGQVFLDGNDTHWASSVTCGEGQRHFAWPTRN